MEYSSVFISEIPEMRPIQQLSDSTHVSKQPSFYSSLLVQLWDVILKGIQAGQACSKCGLVDDAQDGSKQYI